MNKQNPLASLLRTDTENMAIWAAFQHGIEFKVGYLSRSRLAQMATSCRKLVYDKSQKARVPQVDADQFAEQFVSAVVQDWRGLTPRTLSKIAPTKLAGLSEEEKDAPIPFSTEAAVSLVKAGYELDTFLQEVCSDPANFAETEREDALMGNSVSSQPGS